MNIYKFSSLVAASIIIASTSVFAAENQTALTKINGEVMVNQGQTYINAQEGMQLNAGDQLMVMEGGQATIEFADGCLHKLNSNEVFRVSEQSACVANVTAAPQQGPQYTQLGKQQTGSVLALGVAGAIGACAVWCKGDSNNNITGTGNN